MQVHHLDVRRTARYVALGPTAHEGSEVWFALHGYGQLASRFARSFEPIDDGARTIVIPEGLSRYYVDHGDRNVGASWMTREDREHEIRDYVAYLDAVLAAVTVGRGTAHDVHLLGFSQGSATAWRWASAGAVVPRRLVVWGGEVPADLDWTKGRDRLAGLEVVFVAGDDDRVATSQRLADDRAVLEAQGIRHRTVRFAGGHRLDDAVLRQLADA